MAGIPFSSDRMKGYSAFANKVWNAARFVLMNLRDQDSYVAPEAVDELIRTRKQQMPLEDLWILHRLNQVSAEISESLDKFRFHEASALIYQFIWHELCDWYIELVKPVLTNPEASAEEREPRIKVLVHAIDFSLRLLHPFMPFITEEIWQTIPHEGVSIMVQEFPAPRPTRENPEASRKIQDLMELISGIRSLRAEVNIDPRKPLDAVLVISNPEDARLVNENIQKLQILGRLSHLTLSNSLSGELMRGVSRLGEFGLDVHDAINIVAERERLKKELTQAREDIEKVLSKINNPEFLARAPEEVVSEIKARHSELLEKSQKLESNLNHLPLQ